METDIEAYVDRVMKINPGQIAENEQKLIGKFPNTYTFTKNLAEKTLEKRRGDLTVCLLRPAIIASSLSDPFPGWTDSLAAAGGITLLVGLGLINYIHS